MAKKSETKNAKSDNSSSTADTSNAETSSADTSKSDTSSASSESTGKVGGGGSSVPTRPISYFASISTDEYRSGWDSVFGKGGKKLKGSTARRPSKSVSKLPMTITLHGDDLDDNIREQLEAVFRQQAKKKRLNYDKLSGNGQVTLQVSCRISGT